MTKKRNSKGALLASLASVMLCLTMLIGSTFAWFTDTASTSVNMIQAGRLDIELQDVDGNNLAGKMLTFTKAEGAQENEAVLFEPGATFRTNGFVVHQNGDLAFKYRITINGIDGDDKLLKAFEFSIIKEKDDTTTETISLDEEFYSKDFKSVWNISFVDGKPVSTLIKGPVDSDVMYLQVHMKEEAGNEYQGLSISGIGITVNAAQDTVEYDSYSNQYDVNMSISQ